MLQSIRDHAKGWLAWVIVILISIPFALWGVHEYVSPSEDPSVAKVNDVDISEIEYQRNVQQQRQQFRAMMQNPNMDLSFMEDRIRENVLQQMIDNELLLQTAVESQMQVGDNLLAMRIHEMDVFHEDGQFSQALYERLLNNAGMSAAFFEEDMRRDILIAQMRQSVLDSTLVTTQQATQQQQLDNQTRQISYTIIPTARFAAATEVTDAELESHYQNNSHRYMTEEQVSIEYVELKGQYLASEQTIDDATVEQAYQSRLAQFSTPVEWQARHILLTVAQDADETATAAVETQGRELLNQLAAGAEFAELAKTHSQDPGSAAQGGDLGWFGEGTMVTPFEDALKNLAVGERSDLVKTRFGFHIIELTDLKPATTKPFAEVRDELLTTLQTEQAESAFFSQAEQFANLAFEHPDGLGVLADSLKLDIKTTGLFDQMGRSTVPADAELLNHREVINAAFSSTVLQDGFNSEVLELDNQHALALRLREHMPPTLKPLEEVKAQITTELTQDKTQTQAQQLGEQLLAGLQTADVNPDAVLSAEDLAWSESEWVERNAADFQYREVLNEVFKLSHPPAAQQAVYQGIPLNNGSYALVALLAVKTDAATEADATDNDDAPATPDTSALQTAIGETEYQEFMASLKANADIKVHNAQTTTP